MPKILHDKEQPVLGKHRQRRYEYPKTISNLCFSTVAVSSTAFVKRPRSGPR